MRKIWYLNGKRKDRHGGTEQWVSPRLLVALSPRVLFFFFIINVKVKEREIY